MIQILIQQRKGVGSMYRIAILDEDKAYLERLISFLKEHYNKSFEITAGSSLDDLEIDVVLCDALFFGDDVAVDAALFPADIIIGYLTEKSETDERYINKYQSMEQIYRRMIKLCAKDKKTDASVKNAAAKPEAPKAQANTAAPDMKAKTITENGETIRIYSIDEQQVDRLALRMLAGNRIKGLFQTEYRDGGVRIHITGMKSLYEYIRKNNSPRGKEQLLKFMADMIATARSLEEYMLSADRLMLNPREIYVNQAEDKVLVPYIPVKSDAPQDSRQFLEKIRDLCDVLLEGLSNGSAAVSAAKESAGRPDISQKTPGGGIDRADRLSKAPGDGIDRVDRLSKTPGDGIGRSDKFQKTNGDEIDGSDKLQKVSGDSIDGSDKFQKTPSDDTDRPGRLPKASSDSTDRLDTPHKKAKDDPRLKESTKTLRKAVRPYIIRKRTKEKIVVDRNPFKLGKDASCVDYCIKDNPAVSRNHADIVRKADGFYLIDKGSLNHTFVNGKKVAEDEQRKLENGCLMQLANEVFEFRTK